jgi:transposase
MREVINGIFYVTRSGYAWRLVPHDLPPWGTIWYYFRKWRLDGAWQNIHDTLRNQTRVTAGREESPSAAILDSQSAKTTEKGGRGAMTQERSRWVQATHLRRQLRADPGGGSPRSQCPGTEMAPSWS